MNFAQLTGFEGEAAHVSVGDAPGICPRQPLAAGEGDARVIKGDADGRQAEIGREGGVRRLAAQFDQRRDLKVREDDHYCTSTRALGVAQ